MALEKSIDKFFSHIFCVNLDRRKDKWENCVREFSKWELNVERFPAIDGTLFWRSQHKVRPGSIGNCMSKIEIIKLAQERGYDSILVLEDDVEFVPDFNDKFNEWSKEVPDNWDMLWLGGNHNWVKNIPLYSPHLIRITNTYATHAFSLRRTVFEAVLKRLEPLEPEDDIILADIQKSCQAFSFMPNLAYQRPGISDVHNIFTDYSFLNPNR